MLRTTRWFLRALILRCPLCGATWRRRRWLRLAQQCERCDLYLERRENDFFLGAYTINLLAALILAMIGAWVSARMIPIPWLREVGLIVVIMAFATWFYPISKMLWLAVDMLFRPPLERDFDEEVG